MKRLFIVALFLLSENSFSAVNTQYPGCSPSDSTASELETNRPKYYAPQTPLNPEAAEANQALRQQKQ